MIQIHGSKRKQILFCFILYDHNTIFVRTIHSSIHKKRRALLLNRQCQTWRMGTIEHEASQIHHLAEKKNLKKVKMPIYRNSSTFFLLFWAFKHKPTIACSPMIFSSTISLDSMTKLIWRSRPPLYIIHSHLFYSGTYQTPSHIVCKDGWAVNKQAERETKPFLNTMRQNKNMQWRSSNVVGKKRFERRSLHRNSNNKHLPLAHPFRLVALKFDTHHGSAFSRWESLANEYPAWRPTQSWDRMSRLWTCQSDPFAVVHCSQKLSIALVVRI